MGTVQLTAVPVQPVWAVYVMPSICRINTLYPVIAEPPSTGAAQVIDMLLPEIEVVGAAGALGAVNGRDAPFPVGDAAELPIAFVAVT
jgi:hypothetical protein